MATINASAVYVQDMRLTNMSLFYGNDMAKDFALDWIAPSKDVDKDIGQYNRWNRDHQKIVENDIRPDGAEGAVVTFGFTQSSYVAHEYAFQTWLPASVMRLEAGSGLNLDSSIPMMLAEMEAIRKEVRLADAIDDTSYHDSGDNAVTLSGTDQWSDYTNSDPQADVEAGRQKIRRKTGKLPNKAWMSSEVFSKLQAHPKLLNSLKYQGKSLLTIEDLQAIFQIPQIRVVTAQKNTAAYGATDVIADVWGYDFYMTYSQDNPGLMSITTGLHFSRPLDIYPGQRAVTEKRFDNIKGIYWWRRMYTGTYNDVGGADGTSYLIKSAVATPA